MAPLGTQGWGSSPRGRGKRPVPGLQGGHPGLIPARAGKTKPLTSATRSWAAHPRAGGENQAVNVNGLGGQRLIPARAGKTKSSSRSSDLERAHPRAGGENLHGRLTARRGLGSSPRGRGKRRTGLPEGRRLGLIPARAGKTQVGTLGSAVPTAHPRAGGENVSSSAANISMSGSSPRGRGKLSETDRTVLDAGLIPARAGKTRSGWAGWWAGGAHPRAGGENSV